MFGGTISGLRRRMESCPDDRLLLKELSFVVFVIDQDVSRRFRDSTFMNSDAVQSAGSYLMSLNNRALRKELVELIERHPHINVPEVGAMLKDLHQRVTNIPELVISSLMCKITNDEVFEMSDYLNHR